jgi:hypothetical protein
MDEKLFDDKIKNKVYDYEDPDFVPSALDALHQQMNSVSPWPWYSRYRTEIIVGSGLVLCTLIILWSQWYMGMRTAEALNEKILILENQQAQIEKLQNEINLLKTTPPDTFKIVEIQAMHPADYYALLHRIKLLEAAVHERNEMRSGIYQEHETSWRNGKFEWDYAAIDTSLHSRLFAPGNSPKSLPYNDDMKDKQSVPAELSAKTIRELERHYREGLGIKVGPVAEISKGIYPQGSGEFDFTVGVLTDLILSPSLSVETGAKHIHRTFEVEDEDMLSSLNWPGIDESLGKLKNVEIDSWIFEIPVNLKYRYPRSLKSYWLTSVGYSSIIYSAQHLEYEYGIDSNPLATISSTHGYNNLTVYPGMLNFSIGLSNQLKNRKILEASLYYQLGLGKTGIEENKQSFFGVRGVYWFTIK